MFRFPLLLLPAMLVLANCGLLPDANATSRHQNYLLEDPVADAYWQETQLTRDAIALEDQIRTLTIAARGDAPQNGCGARDLSDPSLAHCSESQLKGRWLGRLTHIGIGSQELETDNITPAMAQVFARVESIDTGIDQLLVAQRSETVRLKTELAQNRITQSHYNARLTEMAENRATLAQTLALGAERAQKARRIMEKAQDNGQDGLSWFIQSMRQVEAITLSGQQRLTMV